MYLGIFALNETIYFSANTVNQQGSAEDATAGPIFSIYSSEGSTSIASGVMTKIGSNTGFYRGSFLASDTIFAIGQHFILIEATVDGQTPNANVLFQLVGDDHSLEETFDNIDAAVALLGGSISVDHNYGGTDNYRVLSNGTPIADVRIRAFVKTDYDAGRKANSFVVGESRTKTDGRWVSVIRLDPGTYTLEFSKTGNFQTKTANVTVV